MTDHADAGDSDMDDASRPNFPDEVADPATPLGPPFPLEIDIKGFREDLCAELGNYVACIVKEMMSILELSALEKIWLTNTYGETLNGIDRGVDDVAPLAPTKEDFAMGVAMVVHVKRGNEFKCHVVVDLSLAVSALYDEDDAHKKMSNATIVHELAHVHDFGTQCRVMPDVVLKPLPKSMAGWLWLCVNATWSEYFASFVAAPYNESAIDYLMETFLNALSKFPEEVRQAIIAYRKDANLDGLLLIVNHRFGMLFKFAGYAIGHLEALNKSLREARPDDWKTIEAAGFAPTWEKIEGALFAMHDEYPNWKGLDAYDGLTVAFKDYLETRGFEIFPQDDRFRVNIPFTRDTIPPEAIPLFDLGFPMGRS